MDNIFDSISEWLKELLIAGTINNLTGLFDSVNQGVTDIADHIGQTPQAWNGSVYNMIRTLSNNVIVPIAGLILAFVMTLEFIQLIIQRMQLWLSSLVRRNISHGNERKIFWQNRRIVC